VISFALHADFTLTDRSAQILSGLAVGYPDPDNQHEQETLDVRVLFTPY
jgi:hypothetical protein